MTRFRQLPTALLIAAACGGQPAQAQTPAPPDDGMAHAYMYEVPAGAPQEQQQAPPFIEVSGTGSATVSPDLARAAFAVETQAKTAAGAAQANADAMDAVLKALRAAGIAGLKLESFGYSLQPDYTYPTQGSDQTREISGYTARNNVRATVPDVNAVGKVIDTAVKAGANRVASLSFEASNTEAARRQALDQAVKAARAEAEAIASALGRTLGPALEVHGGADTPGPRPMQYEAMKLRASGADTPIESADQTVTANVTIRFALGPAGGR